ncbi:MAG: hypothetical protein QXK90_02845 [Candidatus Parvarchaeota archaeon]
MRINFWLIVRILSSIAFILFVVFLLLFIFEPAGFGGAAISNSSSLWYALSIAFMTTVSSLSLLLAINPERFWYMMAPLVAGKAASSIASLILISRAFSSPFLRMNMLGDGAIALIFLILLIFAYRKTKI